MREPPELRELIGRDLPPEELERLEHVDALLRGVPAPPHDVPPTLTQAVAAVPHERRRTSRRRVGLTLAFAALVAAVAFGVGRWTGGESFEAAWAVALEPTAEGPAAATARVEVGDRNESGNRELRLEVSGLPVLEEGEFYALWLEADGEWAATCGYFAVGEGATTARMTVSYQLSDFDSWVITTGPRSEEPPPLLLAEIPDA